MTKGFLLWLIVAYSSGPTGGASISIETRDYSDLKQCQRAAEVLEETIKPKFSRVIVTCTQRDIVIDK